MSEVLGQRAAVAVLDRSGVRRAAIVLALLAGATFGWFIGLHAPPAPDLELVHLLRAMAVLKLAFVAAAAGSILWRLQAPVRAGWLAAYAAVCAAMASGPALIWFSSHLIVASILLHAGLAAALVLLWRDGVTSDLLRAAVTRRRAGLSPAQSLAAGRRSG